MTKSCIVYGLRETGSTSVRYVGQTSVDLQERLRRHWHDCRNHLRRPRAMWMRDVAAKGGEIEIFPLETGAIWNESEIRWISRLRQEGADLLNVTDGGEGGVLKPGSQNSNSKLNEAIVSEIIASPERGDAIAERLGVSRATISMIRSGKTWSHVDGLRWPDGRSNLRRFFAGTEPTDAGRDLARRYINGESRDALAVAFATTPTTITKTLAAMGIERRSGGVTKRPLRFNGRSYPGVLAAMRGERVSRERLMREAEFL